MKTVHISGLYKTALILSYFERIIILTISETISEGELVLGQMVAILTRHILCKPSHILIFIIDRFHL